MLKKILLILMGLVIAIPIAGSLVGIKIMQFKAMGDAAAQQLIPPETVNVETVLEQDWQASLSAVGTVVAKQGIVVRNEMEGVVREIQFEAGSMVDAGSILVQLDIDIELSQLQFAEATAEGAARIFKRASELYETNSVSEADYSTADTALKEANAQVDNINAIINKKTIRAPFSGQLGIRRISIGQFLDKGSEVVSLQTLDPVYVEFSLPQQRIGDLSKGLNVAVTSDSYPGQIFMGEITAIEPQVNMSTRNVLIQATMENSNGKLKPGMFVNVEISLNRSESKRFIPTSSVKYSAFGEFVYVVNEQSEGADGMPGYAVFHRAVTLGVSKGDFIEVVEGLNTGERIISTGVFKIRPETRVVIDTKLAPEFSFNPNPENT
ncbi:MAG: efflux RND transporter periplasmic adaptor subunit [Gammaproteobacteria bacterium]|nr:efflux RND transporter periplasmic adaptor subunit [Gammaproteobacteria bacterium]